MSANRPYERLTAALVLVDHQARFPRAGLPYAR
jgi:hypothetical protein